MSNNFRRGRGNPRRIVQTHDPESSGNHSSFYSHDDRGNIKPKFRGNLKSGRIARHRKTNESTRLKHLIENDDDMMGSSTSSVPQRGRYSRAYQRNQLSKGAPNTVSGKIGWNRVTISFGKKFEKEFILKTLLNASRVPFIPIYYHIEGNHSIFYIEDSPAAAEALISLNKQITLPDGFKIIIHVKSSPAPNTPINEELLDKLKRVMSRRYDVVSKNLDLSKFYCDEELSTDYYTPLSRENVFSAVVKIIAENIPDIESIDLSSNKIHSLESMKTLKTKATDLKTLILTNNRISQITSLDCLEGVPLKSLVLNQNPLCERFDQIKYISAVRKRFPKLSHLDGVELPPLISFDIGVDDTTIPPTRLSCFASDESRQLVSTFLEQYLSVYDSDDRQPLLNAYHDEAVMSLTCSYLSGQQTSGASRLDVYIRESRNLKRVEDASRRYRLLQKGKVDVVTLLSKLPKTTHDPRSLVVDVPVASSHLIVASVTGIFKERAERQPLFRWFQRIFLIVPNLNGFCIMNEQLHITNATSDQIKGAFKEMVIPKVGTVLETNEVPQPPAEPLKEVNPDVLRTQMVHSFSEQSGMNLEWSSKCLEENGWNFDHAAYIFSQLQRENKIPPEAFLKTLSFTST